jgi:polar amino acid transport system substrate-binding protein
MLGVVAAFAGCGGSDSEDEPASSKEDEGSGIALLESMKEEGHAKVGVVNQLPYGRVLPTGEVEGVGPDVTEAVLKKLGVSSVEATVITYENAIPNLEASRLDMLAAPLFVTPDRCETIHFSDPIMATTDSFAVPPGNPKGLLSMADAAEQKAKVGILVGSQEIKNALHGGVKRSEISTFPDPPSLMAALEAGRIDAALAASQTFPALPPSEKWEATPVLTDTVVLTAALGFRQEDEDMRDAFNDELAKIRDTEFVEISERWEVDPEPVGSVTTEEACASDFPEANS